MPAVVDEKFESRFLNRGPEPEVELRYTISGSNDEIEVANALDVAAPATFDP